MPQKQRDEPGTAQRILDWTRWMIRRELLDPAWEQATINWYRGEER